MRRRALTVLIVAPVVVVGALGWLCVPLVAMDGGYGRNGPQSFQLLDWAARALVTRHTQSALPRTELLIRSSIVFGVKAGTGCRGSGRRAMMSSGRVFFLCRSQLLVCLLVCVLLGGAVARSLVAPGRNATASAAAARKTPAVGTFRQLPATSRSSRSSSLKATAPVISRRASAAPAARNATAAAVPVNKHASAAVPDAPASNATAAAVRRPRRRVKQMPFNLTCTTKADYDKPPRGVPPPRIHLEGDQFIADGQPIALKGVNWFGFNNRMTFLNGLWAGGSSANSDFAAIIWQLKLLGFNTVRLPFLFEDLKKPASKISGYCTKQSTLQELAQRTVDPEYTGPVPSEVPSPFVPLPDVSTPGSCNLYIPGDGQLTIQRYLWTVQWLVANGLYVLVDYHPMGMEQTSFNRDDFVRSWEEVWGSIACLSNFRRDLEGRVFVDIMNEPDSQWQGWQPKQGKAGMTELYLGVMDALWSMTPGAPIFFINGGGQGNYSGLNWGNGFVTDKGIIDEFVLSDANPFFQTLMTEKPYLNNVVISPHLYGPSVSNRKDFYKGPEWMQSLDKSFGYLNKDGYCYKGRCKTFPIAVGEFGSKFENPEDLAHLADLAAYLNAEGAGDTKGHKAVPNWYYWCYNANSGDTGGLVDDTWMNLQWTKLRYLQKNLGLKPWYQQLTKAQ